MKPGELPDAKWTTLKRKQRSHALVDVIPVHGVGFRGTGHIGDMPRTDHGYGDIGCGYCSRTSYDETRMTRGLCEYGDVVRRAARHGSIKCILDDACRDREIVAAVVLQHEAGGRRDSKDPHSELEWKGRALHGHIRYVGSSDGAAAACNRAGFSRGLRQNRYCVRGTAQ